jgi:hypothetical protein
MAGLGLTFMTVQVVVCLIQLGQPRPARFGWQMYSGLRNPVQYQVVDGGGQPRTIAIREYVAFPRYELDGLEQKVTPLICQDHPDVSAVRFRYVGRPDRDLPCAPPETTPGR